MSLLRGPWATYMVAVDARARGFFFKELLPFVKARGWHFFAGMGTHTFYDPHGETHNARHIYVPSRREDAELQELEALLNQVVPGLPSNSFGSLMPSWDGEKVVGDEDV